MDGRARIYANARYVTQPLTGIQRYAHNLALRLPDLGLITPEAPRAEYGGIPGDRIRIVPSRLRSHLWEQLVLPRAVRKSDVVWSPASIGPLSFANHVMTIHDVAHIEHPEWYGRAFGLWYRSVQPTAARRARHLICVSEFTRQQVMKIFRVPSERITVIHEGLDAAFRRPPQAEIDAEVEARALRQPYVLALGAVSPRKNFNRLLQAWSRVERPDADLVIVGRPNLFFARGGTMDALPSRARHLTNVDDDSLVRLLAGAAAFLYPSLYEGFGLPVLEAMAVGTPVLTSNLTSLPEVAGDAALLVDPYDTDAIAAAITRLLADEALRDDLTRRGADRVACFSWDTAAEQTWAVLSSYAT
jgi:glycosyltransferase involved in cell wall biosynthesis